MIPRIRWHYCVQFLNHYLNATRIDVLHSPFVFGLYNTCIRRKKINQYTEADGLVNQLKKDPTVLKQLDFGSGEPIAHERSVAFLTRQQAKSRRVITILANLIQELGYATGIELGTSIGISACYQGISFRKNGGKLYTIEGAPELSTLAAKNLKTLGLSGTVDTISGNFDIILPELAEQLGRVDYVFIDGNHRYEPTMRYFNRLIPFLNNQSVLVFDDIYWSSEMTRAWNEIKQHPDVRVTVDLFFVGMVFFRKEQAKEDFRLRVW